MKKPPADWRIIFPKSCFIYGYFWFGPDTLIGFLILTDVPADPNHARFNNEML